MLVNPNYGPRKIYAETFIDINPDAPMANVVMIVPPGPLTSPC